MLKLTYKPTKSQLAADPKALPRVVTLNDITPTDFAILKHGVRYLDPDSGMVFIATYDKLEKVELVMDVTKEQREYARAFQLVNSDRCPSRGVSSIEQLKRAQDLKIAREKVHSDD